MNHLLDTNNLPFTVPGILLIVTIILLGITQLIKNCQSIKKNRPVKTVSKIGQVQAAPKAKKVRLTRAQKQAIKAKVKANKAALKSKLAESKIQPKLTSEELSIVEKMVAELTANNKSRGAYIGC